MELLCPRFRDYANLGTGRAPVFPGVVCREDLNFLCRIHIRCADARAVGAGSRCRSSVEKDQILRVARSIEICRTLRQEGVCICQSTATSARNQRSEANRIASIELKRVNLFTRNQLLY